MGILGRLRLRGTDDESPRPSASQVTPPSQQLHHDLQRPRRLMSTTRVEFQELLVAQPARTSGSNLSGTARPVLMLGWKNCQKLLHQRPANNRYTPRQSSTSSTKRPFHCASLSSRSVPRKHPDFILDHQQPAGREQLTASPTSDGSSDLPLGLARRGFSHYLPSSGAPPSNSSSSASSCCSSSSDIRTRKPINDLQRPLPARPRHQPIESEPSQDFPTPPKPLAFYPNLPPTTNPHPLPPARNRINSDPGRP
ncbi:hypothetical protein VP01_2379g1 [Puccinia sorghi]|uniref:Uncharacterized protein n=1 Tax=Puccinia sorghi TaxID=27349 RepID=A0A0L6V7P5_9BASI|nr:hypothetical protein VP01_2379g1 [Puccinia sorghi]